MNDYHNNRLQQFIEQWERLQAEKQDLSSAQKDIMQEAKSAGYDAAVMKAIIKIRKLDPEKRQEQEALLDLYKQELGMS